MPTPPEEMVALWGHWLAPHAVFGWCSACRGKNVAAELSQWRIWAAENGAQGVIATFQETLYGQ